MVEYGIMNIKTGEQDIIFGHNRKEAFIRNHINPEEWVITYAEYID